MTPIASILLSLLLCGFAGATEVLFSGEKKQNNLVSELLEAASISKTGNPLTFTRSSDGWIFISANYKGQGTVRIILDKANDPVTFLWMKRSDKGPNTFSQTIKNLQPGRLYSMKMFSCDYNDLMNQKTKKVEEANKFTGTVEIEGVDVDGKRSFTEMYPSGPEPRIPVWITYHWKVFRARAPTARLMVSDWSKENGPGLSVGLEQTFNFLEIQPYRE